MTDVKVNLRMIVLDILMEIDNGGLFHIVTGNALKKFQYLDKQDRSFIYRLAMGTVEKRIELDYVINQFSSTVTAKQKPVIRNILRMGVYQILYMDKVPESAACNEAVKLAEKKGFRTLKGFVNGVLRNIARNVDSIQYPDKNTNIVKYLSIAYSMPEWIVDMWLKDFGIQATESMLNSFTRNNHTFIRCNTSRITPDELLVKLKEQGIKASYASEVLNSQSVLSIPSYALVIDGYDYLEALELFNDGFFWVQDISSMLASQGDVIKRKDYCLDVCAAPGGKSLNAALIAADGLVESRDLTTEKVALIEDNIHRLGITNIKTKVWDATVVDESAFEKYDVLIADLPCSGLGIIGRKPDIRYNISPEAVSSLSMLQRQILSTIAAYVKPGGVLIYSTCTVSRAENENNVTWFTENFPFSLMGDTLQIKPGDLGNDGFFIARMIKQ